MKTQLTMLLKQKINNYPICFCTASTCIIHSSIINQLIYYTPFIYFDARFMCVYLCPVIQFLNTKTN